ncbi:MAG: heavy metal-binding domain-containing protein, partial [Gemmatimonadota bacterium]
SVIGSTIAKLQTIMGGNITFLTQLCEKTREEAFEILVAHAERVGANAIVGVRYDSSELMPGVSEVLCYGTAVVLEQLDG